MRPLSEVFKQHFFEEHVKRVKTSSLSEIDDDSISGSAKDENSISGFDKDEIYTELKNDRLKISVLALFWPKTNTQKTNASDITDPLGNRFF